MNEEKEIKLPLALLNEVMSYLGSKPYNEAARLIAAVQQVAEPQVQPQSQEAPVELEEKKDGLEESKEEVEEEK